MNVLGALSFDASSGLSSTAWRCPGLPPLFRTISIWLGGSIMYFMYSHVASGCLVIDDNVMPLIVSCVPTTPAGPLGIWTVSHLNLPLICLSPGTNWLPHHAWYSAIW